MKERESRWRTGRRLLAATVAVPLASCTVAVSELAPNAPDGQYLSLVQDMMAESARGAGDTDPPRVDKAVDAVSDWRGADESASGEPAGGLGGL